MTVTRSKKPNLEIIKAALANHTFSEERIEQIYNSCDWVALLEHFGNVNPVSYILLLDKNETGDIAIGAMYNKYCTSSQLDFVNISSGNCFASSKIQMSDVEMLELGATVNNSRVWTGKIAAGKLWKKQTVVEFEKPIEQVVFKLKEGSEIQILECDDIERSFTVFRDSELYLKGDIVPSEDYFCVENYKVTHLAINGEHYKTYTDIGGKWLAIDGKNIAHLSNGFGDGRYTMRFGEGILVR